jgi:signal peptidase I
LVAFILAFIFRAFVVEAFVIPTGSMAPTLLGAHMRFTCNDCGWDFTANYSPEKDSSGNDLIIPSVSKKTFHRVFCPNCGYRMPTHDRANPGNDAHQPEVHYGDRILVLKYLYLFEAPQRWDVVVFKSPAKDDDTLEKPTYQQNYIKRLIGNPGESVLILDGDIYIGRDGQKPEEYQIQTKPRYVQQALWRVIYDNDFHPRAIRRDEMGGRWRQPWTVRDGTGWDVDDKPTNGRVFRFNNAAGESTLFFDRTANSIAARSTNTEPYAFTDWLAYDSPYAQNDPIPAPPMNVVHDLKLAFFYERTAGAGPLRAKLTSGDDVFVAEITPTEAKLLRPRKDGSLELIAPSHSLAGASGPLRVELTNVDYQVTLRINDEDVARTTPQQFRPDVPALLAAYKAERQHRPPSVEITAADQTAALSHVGVWRDVYYLNRDSAGRPLYWGVPHNIPERIIHLGKDEYFVLGDNSLISGDARYWQVPIDLPADDLNNIQSGRVPGRFMLGRAFFVYWPAGFRPAPQLPGITPDFGDMRFIR